MNAPIKTAVFVLAVCLLLAGCGSDVGEQSVGLVEKMADIFDKNKSDCNKMASELDTFIKDNDAAFKRLKEASAKQTPEQKKAFDEKYKPRIDAAMKKLQPGLMACATNTKVQDAMKQMPR